VPLAGGQGQGAEVAGEAEAEGARGSADRTLTIFDEVRVALCVEERASFRKELVVRIIDPPFHVLHVPAGFTVEDATGGRPLASATATIKAARAAAAAAAASGDGSGGKRALALEDTAAAGHDAAAPAPKRAKTAISS